MCDTIFNVKADYEDHVTVFKFKFTFWNLRDSFSSVTWIF